MGEGVPAPLQPNGLLAGPLAIIEHVASGSGSRPDVEGEESRVRQRSGESYVRDLPLAKRPIVAALQNPIVAALQKELASVNERKERLDARKARFDARQVRLEAKKERLEELIVEFTGDEEEEEEEEDW